MKLTAFLAALLLGTTAMAQTAAAPAAPAWTFALHGFVSFSGGYQSGLFAPSDGQQSLDASTPLGTLDRGSLIGDVRQSRFNFSVKGPQVLGGATPTGVLEIDWMQGFGGGNYGDVSLLPRMRVAYGELNWGPMAKLQFGQQNDLVFAMAPTSLSHIAFPLGYFTGNIGWRRPGIFGYHTLGVAPDAKVELAWEVGRSQYIASPAVNGIGGGAGVPSSGIGGVNCANTTTAPCQLGEASGAPAVEGRISLAYAKYLNAFVAAHWQNNDASGIGDNAALTTSSRTFQTAAYNAGFKVTAPLQGDVGVTLAATGFTGKNIAPLVGNLTTGVAAFAIGPNLDDVKTWGYWAQLGVNLTKEFSLWGFYGEQQINKTDFAKASFTTFTNTGAFAAAAYDNVTTNVIAMYRDGGWGFSLEWIDFQTKYAAAGGTNTGGTVTAISSTQKRHADQYLFSANYYF